MQVRPTEYYTTITTDGSGDGTGTVGPVNGRLVEIRYVKAAGGAAYDNGVTFAITGTTSGKSIWAEAAVNASKICCPRRSVHTTAGVEDATNVEPLILINETITITVSSGGASNDGTFYVVMG